MSKIKIAIVGVGNCACSLIEGISYYQPPFSELSVSPGLMHLKIENYYPSDIEPVLAFDIDERKVGVSLNEAIHASPNCAIKLIPEIPKSNVIVRMGNPLDGIAGHMFDYPEERRFVLADKEVPTLKKVAQLLKESEAEILINYLPVGSEQATCFYAAACLMAGVSLLNCIPVFIVSNPCWAKRFKEKGIPVVGDDVKSQLGATITHRVLTKLFEDRGVKIDRMYQLNTGGNTDFLNMLERSRLRSKKISKTEAVQSQMKKQLSDENIHIGPSDYVPWQKDNKVCFIRIEGRGFAGAPVSLELRLSVEDSPNSAGVVIDAIRCLKLARMHKLAGHLEEVSAYYMKHPPRQMSDDQANKGVEAFIQIYERPEKGQSLTIEKGKEKLAPIEV